MCAVWDSGLHGKGQRVKAPSECSKWVVNSVSLSRDLPVFPGFFEIIRVFNDKNKKRSLLFALDWFMDPYFKQDISDIHNELVELLQTVVISSTDDDVSEDALQLLCDYEWPPFEILEKNINRVSQRLKPDVLYAVNMDKEI